LACLFAVLGYLLGHALWQLRVLQQWEKRQTMRKPRTDTRSKPDKPRGSGGKTS